MKIKIMRSFFPPSDWQGLIMTRVFMFSCKVDRNVNCNFSDQYISKLEIYIPIYPIILFLFFFLAAPSGMWDLSFLTGNS